MAAERLWGAGGSNCILRYVSKLPKVSKYRFPRLQVDGSEGKIKADPQGQLDTSRKCPWLVHLPSSTKAGRKATVGSSSYELSEEVLEDFKGAMV